MANARKRQRLRKVSTVSGMLNSSLNFAASEALQVGLGEQIRSRSHLVLL